MALLDLSILGNKYINSDFKYNTDPGAGVRNREEYARQFGQMGERLVEELGKGHHGPDVANLPPQLAPRPHTVRQRRKVKAFCMKLQSWLIQKLPKAATAVIY